MFIYSECDTLTEEAPRFMDMSKCQNIFVIYTIKDDKRRALKRSEYPTYFEKKTKDKNVTPRSIVS